MDVHFVRQWRVAKKSSRGHVQKTSMVRWEEGSQRMTEGGCLISDGKNDDSEDVWEGG